MLSQFAEPIAGSDAPARSLLLVWRNPTSRKYSRVARLEKDQEARFNFHYLESARSVEGFYPLDEYPHFEGLYSSPELPAFFANRVMSSSRPGYSDYLKWLGIDDSADLDVPVEVLARTGGGRATDTFHVVEMPSLNESHFASRFFVSGVRHADGGLEASQTVNAGDLLFLRAEPDNPVNSLAKIIDTATQKQIGWLPDWLCDEVDNLESEQWSLSLSVEKVNPEAPPRSRILCKLEAIRL